MLGGYALVDYKNLSFSLFSKTPRKLYNIIIFAGSQLSNNTLTGRIFKNSSYKFFWNVKGHTNFVHSECYSII